MLILLLEDDCATADYLCTGLGELGFRLDCCADGASAVTALLGKHYDLMILDRVVPKLDGLSVLKAVRAAGCSAPALLLSALARVEDRVDGLDAGADDYLVKPFAFCELVARIRALARRCAPCTAEPVLRAGGLEMDLLRHRVCCGGRMIDLKPREFRLLECLLRNAGAVVTRTMLLEQVWELGFDPGTNIVETQISRLRARLDMAGGGAAIRTVRGAGYMVERDGP